MDIAHVDNLHPPPIIHQGSSSNSSTKQHPFHNDDMIETIEDVSVPHGFGGHLVDENLVRVEGEDKFTWYLAFLIMAAAISGFLNGYDTGVVGVALPLVGDELTGKALSSSQQEIITSGTTIGAIIGAAIIGAWGDRLGRKGSIFISDICFTIGAVLIASSYSVAQMIVGRIVLGFGVGGAILVAPLFIAETAPTAMRGRCLGVNAFFIPFGQVVSVAIGSGLQNTHNNWRLLFALGVVPSVLQLGLFHWLPESPRILIVRGRIDESRAVFQRIYPTATSEMIDYKLRVAEEYVKATTILQSGTTFRQLLKTIFTTGSYRRSIICITAIQAFCQLSGFNSLVYYSSTLFGLLGITNPALGGLIPSSVNAFFVLMGFTLSDRVGRRRLFTIMLPVMLAGLVWCIVAFHNMCKATGGFLDTSYTYPTGDVGIVIGGIVVFVAGYGSSYSALSWYQSEFLALEVRSVGCGIATVVAWIANLVVSITYLTELETLTPAGTYGLYLGISFVGYIFVLFCYPETKQLSIEETTLLFEEDWGIKRSKEMRREKDEAKRRIRDVELAESAQAHVQARQQKSTAVSSSDIAKFLSELKQGAKGQREK
ncbi:hypothetical protein IAT38_006927 [Cryptococcus sp. DSM 104549]